MKAPLIVHVIYRLDFGGLENGLVNLINGLPEDRYRHVVVSLTDATTFRQRIERDDVQVVTLHKRPGIRPDLYFTLWRLFRRLRPAIVHSRNLAALEAQLPAGLAGVPVRIHGEHGWDVEDLHGTDRKRRWIRRRLRPWVHRYVALSRHIREYLQQQIQVSSDRIVQIYNGVDVHRFTPSAHRASLPETAPGTPGRFVVGTVGRLQAVKDQQLLIRAVSALVARRPDLRERLYLVVVGDGPEREALNALIAEGGIRGQVWMTGSRDDVPDLMRAMDLFVLPSLAEGICNTVLEAMACGRPVIATAVGGNPELLEPGVTGELVPAGEPEALADAIEVYADDPERARRHGLAARQRAETAFSLDAMVAGYQALYDELLWRAGIRVNGPLETAAAPASGEPGQGTAEHLDAPHRVRARER